MINIRGWTYALAGVLVALLFVSESGAEEALAFITDVQGEVTVTRADGTQEAATLGAQLFGGDEIKASKGTAVIVYRSGRSVTVKAETPHRVLKKTAGASGGMKRLFDTLGEMVGEAGEADRPAVHGMARNLPLTGATPANTRVSGTDFSFSWDALEGAEKYVFILQSEDGDTLAARTLTDAGLPADSLNLQPATRYFWTAGAEFLIPHSTGKNRLDIASREDAEALQKSIGEIEKDYTGTTQSLLKAAACYRGGYYFEAKRILEELKGEEDAASVQKMLMMIRLKMQPEVAPSPSEK